MWDLSKFHDNVAAIDEFGQKISYSVLNDESAKLLDKIGKRCLVFSLCTNTIGSFLGYVSFINHKIVPVMLSNHIDDMLLSNLLVIYCPSFIWVPAEKESRFKNFKKIHEAYGYVLLRTFFETEYKLNKDLALLLTTSGSTGSPKFVRQSYENIRENTASIVEYLELDSSERPITTLPMNYTYGLSIIQTHLKVGATILLTDKGLMQKEFWSFFKEQEATSFGGVPYTYEMLDKLRFHKMKLPSLRTMTQAGGKITPELHEKFARYAEEQDKKFIVMYGQCEATARMGYLPADKAIEKIGSMGIAIPGGKLRLFGTDGKEILEPYVIGELVYEGKNVTLGYAENGEDLALGDERHGVLETGDMAQFDGDGYFYIIGRKKRFLKIYGNRVNLDEVDRLIKAEFENIDVASTGIDDHMYIFITESELSNQVKQFIAAKTKLNPAAFMTIVIDEIPKNDAGKILYKELTKYYE